MGHCRGGGGLLTSQLRTWADPTVDCRSAIEHQYMPKFNVLVLQEMLQLRSFNLKVPLDCDNNPLNPQSEPKDSSRVCWLTLLRRAPMSVPLPGSGAPLRLSPRGSKAPMRLFCADRGLVSCSAAVSGPDSGGDTHTVQIHTQAGHP